MIRCRIRRLAGAGAIAAAGCLVLAVGAQAKPKSLTVCKHGCRYSTIQGAVSASGKNATIKVKPGTYVEGVIVQGHRHDGLRIIGATKNPAKVLIEGKNAKGPGGAAQNGIEGDGVDNLVLENMKAEHFAANGFYVNGCSNYLFKNLIGAFEHAYGLFAFRCIGGRMTHSTGYGNGDSAFYVGGTPFEKKPVETLIDHDIAYENILGYSGTNSKYVTIENGQFYNNGTGIAPNTLVSEPFEPTEDGVIKNNLIFWNNFDYYRKTSPVKTVSSGVGPARIQYPVGVGVLIFGGTGWVVKDNSIFGNFLIGGSTVSDPTNKTGKAINVGNQFINNQMGAAFNDANGADFFNDGSGHGSCFANNGTVTLYSAADAPDSTLYPTCPATNGTGKTTGDPDQLAVVAQIVSQTTGQEKFWHVHTHPARPGVKPFEG
jgi:Right handed beta helix region